MSTTITRPATTSPAPDRPVRMYPIADSATMLRRKLRHALRYPGMTILTIGTPLIFLLLFVYVLGDTLGAGLGGDSATAYLAYLVPGILLMTISACTMPTAVAVCVDMAEGIVARFRTMAISRVSLLTGHVLGSVIQTMISVALVLGVTLLMGFRPDAGPMEWLGVIGMVALATLALTWLSVALGLVTKKPEGASNVVLPLLLLPMLGSGFVPTDSMPSGLAWFAEHQPFTPIIETLRALLAGAPIGNCAGIAVAWCVGLTVVGYVWAKVLFSKDRSG